MEIGKEFMAKTRHGSMPVADQQKGRPQPPLELPREASQRLIDLRPPAEVRTEAAVLRELIERRRSVREYAREPISPAELSYLLWCTQGVQEAVPGHVTLRTVPSAGARHALETYLLVNRVEGLGAGLYRFLAIGHQLAEVSTRSGLAAIITRACYGQEFVATSAVTFLWTAIVYRMSWRYSQRGYRYLHLDAGHVCQNLYLAAESIGCGCCAIAAFDDDALNAALGADGQEQFAIYLATVGKKP
jgi:SagB-type dehydrogenase family enzyme